MGPLFATVFVIAQKTDRPLHLVCRYAVTRETFARAIAAGMKVSPVSTSQHSAAACQYVKDYLF